MTCAPARSPGTPPLFTARYFTMCEFTFTGFLLAVRGHGPAQPEVRYFLWAERRFLKATTPG